MQNAKCTGVKNQFRPVKSERGKLNVASCSSAEVYVADNTNSTTDGFWRTTSKLFLLHLSLHMFLMAPIMMVVALVVLVMMSTVKILNIDVCHDVMEYMLLIRL